MQRILIVGNNSLIGAGIEGLLRQQGVFDVCGIADETAQSLLLIIKQFQPHVIFLDRHSSTISADQLWLMLPRPCTLSLVEIDAGTSYLRILTPKQIWFTRLTNVISAIDWSINQNKREIIFLLKEAASI